MKGVISALLAVAAYTCSQAGAVIVFPAETGVLEKTYMERRDVQDFVRQARSVGGFPSDAESVDTEMAKRSLIEPRDEEVAKRARSIGAVPLDADAVETEMTKEGYVDRRDSEHVKVTREEVEQRSLDRRLIWARLRRCYFFIVPIVSRNNDTVNATESVGESSTTEEVVTVVLGNDTEVGNGTETPAGNETVVQVLVIQRCFYYYYPFFPRPRLPIGPIIWRPRFFNATRSDNSTITEPSVPVSSEPLISPENATDASPVPTSESRRRRDFGRYGPVPESRRPYRRSTTSLPIYSIE